MRREFDYYVVLALKGSPYFMPLAPFYILLKQQKTHQKTWDFLIFPGNTERD